MRKELLLQKKESSKIIIGRGEEVVVFTISHENPPPVQLDHKSQKIQDAEK